MNSIFLMYVPPFLPYFAFALIVVAGCWTKNDVAIWAGIIILIFYNRRAKATSSILDRCAEIEAEEARKRAVTRSKKEVRTPSKRKVREKRGTYRGR